MSKSITVDRIKLIAEMARQNITGEELAQKSGVSRCSIIKIHNDTPLSSGTIVTGRVCYDAFVLDNKKTGIYYQATT